MALRKLCPLFFLGIACCFPASIQAQVVNPPTYIQTQIAARQAALTSLIAQYTLNTTQLTSLNTQLTNLATQLSKATGAAATALQNQINAVNAQITALNTQQSNNIIAIQANQAYLQQMQFAYPTATITIATLTGNPLPVGGALGTTPLNALVLAAIKQSQLDLVKVIDDAALLLAQTNAKNALNQFELKTANYKDIQKAVTKNPGYVPNVLSKVKVTIDSVTGIVQKVVGSNGKTITIGTNPGVASTTTTSPYPGLTRFVFLVPTQNKTITSITLNGPTTAVVANLTKAYNVVGSGPTVGTFYQTTIGSYKWQTSTKTGTVTGVGTSITSAAGFSGLVTSIPITTLNTPIPGVRKVGTANVTLVVPLTTESAAGVAVDVYEGYQ